VRRHPTRKGRDQGGDKSSEPSSTTLEDMQVTEMNSSDELQTDFEENLLSTLNETKSLASPDKQLDEVQLIEETGVEEDVQVEDEIPAVTLSSPGKV
jgi:hypothetical protein